jgi:hypothetical protein
VGRWGSLEGAQGEGGALGDAESLTLHFGELSKVNGRVEGGVRGGVVLMHLTLPWLVGPMSAYGRHGTATWRQRPVTSRPPTAPPLPFRDDKVD